MLDETLLEYIKETLGAGFDEEHIRQQLQAASWTEQEIAEAFAAAKRQTTTIQFMNPVRPPSPITPTSPGPTTVGPTSPMMGEVEEGWFSRHKGTLVTILLVIILLPLEAYAGYWAYQKYFKAAEEPAPAQTPNKDQAVSAPNPAEAKTRDQQRLKDIANLQTSLTNYYQAKSFYPKTLQDLSTEKILEPTSIKATNSPK